MEIIITIIEKGALAFLALAAYICLVGSVYPWFCMRLSLTNRGAAMAGVRGLRRVTFPDGRGVVYEPALAVRRYVPQYALYTENGSIYLRCMLDPHVKFIRYDALALDVRGRLLEALCVEEKVTKTGVTKPVVLPTGTSFVRVVPRVVDGMYVSREKLLSCSWVLMGIYAVLTVLTTVGMAGVVYSFVAEILANTTTATLPAMTSVLLAALLCGVATAGISLLSYFNHAVGVANR